MIISKASSKGKAPSTRIGQGKPRRAHNLEHCSPGTVFNLLLCATFHCVQPFTVCNLSLCATFHCVQPFTVCNLSLCATFHCVQPFTVCNLSLHTALNIVLQALCAGPVTKPGFP